MSKEETDQLVKLDRTRRGFVYGQFVDRYGQQCSIQKSSLVADDLDGECIWFGVENNDHSFKIFSHDGGGWKDKTLGELFPGHDISIPDRMHLTRKMVIQLLPLLQHFAETGELPENS